MDLRRDGRALAWDEAGRGDPPLLLLHGWGGDRGLFERLVEPLAAGHRVVRLDLRGFGESEAASEAAIEDHTGDVAFVLDALDLDRPVVVGHSLGGMVALDLAARHPARCAAVVLLEAPIVTVPGFFAGVRRVLEGLRTADHGDVTARFVRALAGPQLDEAARAGLVRTATACPRSVLASGLEALLAFDGDAAARRVTCPVLYVGTGTPYADLDRFRALCPQLRSAQLAGCGHYFPLEAPERLAAILAGFVDAAVRP